MGSVEVPGVDGPSGSAGFGLQPDKDAITRNTTNAVTSESNGNPAIDLFTLVSLPRWTTDRSTIVAKGALVQMVTSLREFRR